MKIELLAEQVKCLLDLISDTENISVWKEKAEGDWGSELVEEYRARMATLDSIRKALRDEQASEDIVLAEISDSWKEWADGAGVIDLSSVVGEFLQARPDVLGGKK